LGESSGQTIGRYRIEGKLGEGGMGVVYRARDAELDREVAVKVLPESVAGDPDRLERFRREARAIAKLSHPNILAIHDFGREGEVSYAVTELLDGEDLRQALGRQAPFSVERSLTVARSVAAGLAAAHDRQIIHRDIKPANIFLTAAGEVKILDFGLARSESETMIDTPAPGEHEYGRTKAGTIVGTVGYMSPEQARGRPTLPASDVFSLGCVLFEMLTGVAPFRRATETDTLSAILKEDPPALEIADQKVPRELERVIRKALEKEPETRYATAGELERSLAEISERLAPPPPVAVRSLVRLLTRPRVLIPAMIVVAVAAVLVGRWLLHASKMSWARQTAIPEIVRLLDEDDFVGAFALAQEARQHLPSDPTLDDAWGRIANTISVRTEPAGATVSYREFADVDGPWTVLGQTPLEEVAFPRGAFRWRISKEGYQTRVVARRVSDPVIEAQGTKAELFSTDDSSAFFSFTLDPEGGVPEGMVAVDGGTYSNMPIAGLRGLDKQELGRFLIDRTEVTNRDFREFVEAGGYLRRDLWTEEFLLNGKALSLEEAMARFRDTTERPGPATWELGDYPEDEGDHPVAGVSWYEAAAYCEYAGKSLPTVYHWARAALPGSELLEPMSPFIIPLSNLQGDGPAAVASFPGIGISGAHDMAGNVREWCWNSSGDRRYVLGGAWSDPVYGFTEAWTQPAWDRLPINGIRCAKYLDEGPVEEQAAPVEPRPVPDFYGARERSDEVFEAEKRFYYSYDRAPLDAVVDSEGESPFGGREQWVSVDAGYGDERLPIRLHLPEGGTPPYQAVVWFPGAGLLYVRSVREHDPGHKNSIGFIVKSGRAVIQPIYDGSYERNDGRTPMRVETDSGWRELYMHWLAEIGRTLDYLEERPDIDAARVAYAGASLGAGIGVDILAYENRFRAALLWSGGFDRGDADYASEQVGNVKRITIPVLMINGRYDGFLPVDTLQRPMFDLLGTPAKHKRHVVFDAGHWPFPRGEFIRENLAWLDSYLGPVGE
jgi:formylglycine-generating enzyme required for sulfatase activity